MTQDNTRENSTEKHKDIKKKTNDESFVDAWMRKSQSNSDLDNDILALIDEHRDRMLLDEDSLYQALLNHVKEKLEDDE